MVVKAIIFSIKVIVAHSDRALRNPPFSNGVTRWGKWSLGQRAEVLRVCLVKPKIGSLLSVVRYEVLTDIVRGERKPWQFKMSQYQWTR